MSEDGEWMLLTRVNFASGAISWGPRSSMRRAEFLLCLAYHHSWRLPSHYSSFDRNLVSVVYDQPLSHYRQAVSAAQFHQSPVQGFDLQPFASFGVLEHGGAR